ncbi:hypothetical protein [uncultured Winogradskyella sp.]|uniref:hypothetical protein n=1 Tax=uncultured Winogradskyella sp. TaxID=395353 RepID=UPI0026200766|nr:hypothetical protein [uncultured Winogradskyella sp.]
MNNFENIQSEWQNQPDIEGTDKGLKEVFKKTNELKNKQQITNIILGITIAILIGFFLYVKAYLEVKATLSLGLMIMVLIARIIIELLSINNLKGINYNLDFKSFKESLLGYYKRRVTTHYIFTPIILLLYVIGFLILMPYFEAGLSSGFYTYIQVSGVIVLVLGVFLIFNQAKKELYILKELMSE